MNKFIMVVFLLGMVGCNEDRKENFVTSYDLFSDDTGRSFLPLKNLYSLEDLVQIQCWYKHHTPQVRNEGEVWWVEVESVQLENLTDDGHYLAIIKTLPSVAILCKVETRGSKAITTTQQLTSNQLGHAYLHLKNIYSMEDIVSIQCWFDDIYTTPPVWREVQLIHLENIHVDRFFTVIIDTEPNVNVSCGVKTLINVR